MEGKEKQTGGNDVRKIVVVEEGQKNDRFDRIWDSLSEAERQVIHLLPLVVALPAGSPLEFLLEIGVMFDRESLIAVLEKLQLEEIVAVSSNWVWVLNYDFINYLESTKGVNKPFILSQPEKIVFQEDSGRLFLFGRTVMFKVSDDVWESVPIEFRADITGKRPISTFIYRKPLVTNKCFDLPTEFETSTRVGIIPLVIAREVRRPPGHLYMDDDILVAAVNMGDEINPNWQMKCFPKSCVPLQTWEEAEEWLRKSS